MLMEGKMMMKDIVPDWPRGLHIDGEEDDDEGHRAVRAVDY